MKVYLTALATASATVDPSKLNVNRELTTGVLKIRRKKETIEGGEGLQRHTI